MSRAPSLSSPRRATAHSHHAATNTDAILEDLFAPIPVGNFHRHVANHHRLIDGPCDHYDYDMEVLHALSSHPSSLALLYTPTITDQPKNRYCNVLPNAESRVMVSEDGYINASLVDKRKFPFPCVSYIAAQAPLPHTMTDFFTMVWEQSSSVLVMLTRERERREDVWMKKADRYWPENVGESVVFGHWSLTLTRCDTPLADTHSPTDNDCDTDTPLTVRHLTLTNTQTSGDTRNLVQLQFVAWPDHGVPDDMTEFDHFFSLYRQYRERSDGPIIIHCSAGIGRTGTFATIDLALDSINHQLSGTDSDTGTVSVSLPSLIRTLRESRAGMVQTKDQYVFAHHFIDYCITHHRFIQHCDSDGGSGSDSGTGSTRASPKLHPRVVHHQHDRYIDYSDNHLRQNGTTASVATSVPMSLSSLAASSRRRSE